MDDDKARESRERDLLTTVMSGKPKPKTTLLLSSSSSSFSRPHSFFMFFVCLVVVSSCRIRHFFSLVVFQGNSSPRQNFLTRSLNHFLFLSSFPIVFLFFIIRQRQSHFGFFLYCIIESECIITNDK